MAHDLHDVMQRCRWREFLGGSISRFSAPHFRALRHHWLSVVRASRGTRPGCHCGANTRKGRAVMCASHPPTPICTPMAEAWTTEKVLADPVPAIGRVEPFAPQVAKPRLVEDLRLRLNPAIARLASADRTLPWEILPSDLGPQQQAPDPTLLRDQLAYWASIFDFDALQAKLARWPHYVADIDWCHRCHFVHQRSSRPDAIPLLLLHGWPSSFYEFWDLIEPLTEPSACASLYEPAVSPAGRRVCLYTCIHAYMRACLYTRIHASTASPLSSCH